jgi:hypothetical protein
MRKISEDMARSFWDFKPMKRDNTEVFHNRDGEICMKLWDTTVARISLDGFLVINNGGYLTTTTKSRINAVLELLGYHIRQKKGIWYLYNSQNEETQKFENGMRIRI